MTADRRAGSAATGGPPRSSGSRLPRLASGGLMPKPRNERAASVTTESAMPRVRGDDDRRERGGQHVAGGDAPRRLAPRARAACTKSASRSVRNSARTSRHASVQPVRPMAMMTTDGVALAEERHDHDDHEEDRQRQHDVDEAHDQVVDPAAEEAGDRAQGDADAGDDGDGHEADEERRLQSPS